MLFEKIEKIITEELKSYVFTYNENEENIEKIPESFIQNFKTMALTKKTKNKNISEEKKCTHIKKDGEQCSYKIFENDLCKIHSKVKERLNEKKEDVEIVKKTCKYIFPKKGTFCKKSPKKGDYYCSSHLKNKNSLIAKSKLHVNDSESEESMDVDKAETKEINLKELKNIQPESDDEYPIDYSINIDKLDKSSDEVNDDDD